MPPVFVVPPDGNLVSGNGENGILIDADSQNNVLNGNFIGTTANGDGGIGNSADGVRITKADDNSLVGCKFRNDPFVYYNVLSGNGENGLRVTDANNVTVQGNFFGIGADNTNILANKADGILVEGSSLDTVVGGVIPLGNVSAGNARNGIEVKDTVSGFTTFNTFGGLLAFKGAAPNGNDGLLVTATGGNQTVRTNVFSGNANNGVEIAGDASGVAVDPIIAGLNTTGGGLLPNGNDGVLVGSSAHGNLIGGYLDPSSRKTCSRVIMATAWHFSGEPTTISSSTALSERTRSVRSRSPIAAAESTSEALRRATPSAATRMSNRRRTSSAATTVTASR